MTPFLTALAQTLGRDADGIDATTRCADLGLDSLAATRLCARHDTGAAAPRVEDVLRCTTVGDVAALFGDGPVQATAQELPTPTRSAPLTPVQSSYWVGRDPELPLGSVATFWFNAYTVRTDDPQACLDRLEVAFGTLVRTHPALRITIDRDGTQRVRDDLVWAMPRVDLRGRGDAAAAADAVREEHSHQVLTDGDGPLFFVAGILLDDEVRVHVGFDAMIVDLRSWQLIMRQWGALVQDPSAVPTPSEFDFLGHVAAESADPQRSAAVDADRAWWDDAHGTAPEAAVEVVVPQGLHRFRRRRARIAADDWSSVVEHARARGCSPTAVVLAAFAHALDRHGERAGGNITLTLDARPDHPAAADVVGDFARTAPFRAPGVDTAAHFGAYAQDVARGLYDLLEHPHLCGLDLARQHGWPAGSQPIVFTSGLGGDDASWDGWLGGPVAGVSQTPQVVLDHLVWQEDGALVLTMDSVDEALPEGFTAAVLGAVEALLLELRDARAWEDPRLGRDPSGRLPVPIERRSDCGPLLHDPFRARPADHARAVICDGREVTVAQLQERARDLAAVLRAHGIGPGDRVVVAAPKSVAQVVAVLGVLEAGAAYLPVDPAWPDTRVEAVVRRSKARAAVVADGAVVADVGTLVSVDSDGCPPPAEPRTDQGAEPSVDELAYAIFTSGSTGEPKGVAQTHHQVRTTLDDVCRRFEVTERDAVLGLSALSFDLSIFDLAGVLGVGGRLVLPNTAELRDPGAWCRLIEAEQVTIWNSAPALLEMLVEHAEHHDEDARRLRSLRLVMLSGDWIPVTLPDRMRAIVPEVSFNSLGGATEAAIWSITFPVGDVDPQWKSIPYGRPLDGQNFHVLDGERPCRVGETGELFIAGEAVASGYLEDPERTAERFGVDPATGERRYRTGDLGRWRRDGNIEFLGRVDRQVKVQGFRIELGEVEAGLGRCDGVRQAVAGSVPGPDGRPRLVAWVAGAGLDVAGLRARAVDQLPSYMVPSRFVLMEALPVTENGKIDHKQLGNPFESAGAAPAPVEPAVGADEAAESDESVEVPEPVADEERPERRDVPGGTDGATADAARSVVLDVLGADRLPESSFAAAGASSLTVLRLANALEDHLGERPSLRSMMEADDVSAWFAELCPVQSEVEDHAADEVAPPAPAGVSPEVPTPVAPATGQLPAPPEAFEIVLGGGAPTADRLGGLADWMRGLEQWADVERREVQPSWTDSDGGLRVSVAACEASPARTPSAVSPVAAQGTEPFGLTEMQLAYLVGRTDDWLGTPVGPHYYTDAVVKDLDVDRLRAAWRSVVEAHPMLRARATADGRQQVLAVDVDGAIPQVEVFDLRHADAARIDQHLGRVRGEWSHQVVDPMSEAGLRLGVTLTASGAVVHLGVDLLFLDAASAVLVVEDLRRAYEGQALTPPRTDFRGWISRSVEAQDERRRADARDYWTRRAAELGAPALADVRVPGRHVVRRHEQVLDAQVWRSIGALCAEHGVTPTSALLGVLGPVVGVAGERRSVVVTAFDRPADHAGVVGDYTSTVVTDLPADGATVADLVQRTHESFWRDLEHSSVAGGLHGNEVMRMSAAAGRGRRFPVAFSSGLGSVSGSDGRARDAGRLLDGWGETGEAISQTPHVAIDVQVFEVDGRLVLRWDAVDDAYADGWVTAAFGRHVDAVRSLGTPHVWRSAPAPAEATPVGAPVVQAPTPESTVVGDARVEERVRQALAGLLDRPVGEIDGSTPFFDLGATSLDLVRLRQVLADDGFEELTVVDVFAHPSVRSLAARIGSDGPAPSDRPAPVTPVAAVTESAAAPARRGDRRRRARELARRMA